MELLSDTDFFAESMQVSEIALGLLGRSFSRGIELRGAPDDPKKLAGIHQCI